MSDYFYCSIKALIQTSDSYPPSPLTSLTNESSIFKVVLSLLSHQLPAERFTGCELMEITEGKID